ncbi:MAG: R2-like ligand-binding oxidase [Candidatus Hydrogenedentes bacterium]|nr:R2-like ligand-binding oxidase [Candidatus Hydrogenedentota bacterium]
MPHSRFTTTTRGLRRDTPPMLLFERAKKLGVWNPSEIDFSKDKADWARLNHQEKDIVLRLSSMFVAGEEAVTLDLLPLIRVVANEGRTEEELYLATFLWEEAKHVDFFSRVLAEVCGAPADLTAYQEPNYRKIVCEALPMALRVLEVDHSPAAQARASTVYNMIVEGMLAETGYHAYFTIIDRCGILPGVREGIGKLKQDESRHIAYGVYLLSRLISADPSLWSIVESTLNDLFPVGLAVVTHIFSHYDPPPFGVSQDEFLGYAAAQYQKRFQRLERARDLSFDQVIAETQTVVETGDA